MDKRPAHKLQRLSAGKIRTRIGSEIYVEGSAGLKAFQLFPKPQKPEQKVKDGKIKRRSVERMAKERVDDAAFWEKRYKGYRFIRCYSRYNEYNGNWYVSVVMYKTDGDPPDWKEKEWITTDYT